MNPESTHICVVIPTLNEEGTLPVLNDRIRQRKVLRLSVMAAAAVGQEGYAAGPGVQGAAADAAAATEATSAWW